MKKLLIILTVVPFLTFTAHAEVDNPLNFQETDGSPTTYPWRVNVSNGSLTDGGDGTITIATGGGTVAGSNTQVQFNDSGSFGGDGAFSWFSTPNSLSISRDSGQTGEAIRISSDTGASLANISHDGTASFVSLSTPTIIGGGSTTDDLTLKTTTGVGASGADMHFLVGNNGATEAMTILNSGNVGIGTTSPGTLLHVGANAWPSNTIAAPTTSMLITHTSNPYLVVENSNSTVAANASGEIYLGGRATTSTNDMAYVRIIGAKENATSGNYASYFQVKTINSTGTEQTGLRIDSSGNVGIGDTSPTALFTVGNGDDFQIDSDGIARFSNDAAVVTDAAGETAFDTNAWATSRGALQVYDGTASTYILGALASDVPSNLEVPKWNTGGTITWEADSGAVGGSNAQVQYNNDGVQAGEVSLTWDDITNTLSISRDAGQSGLALNISSDTALTVASISHDGGATFDSLTLKNRLSVDSGGTGGTTHTDGSVLLGNGTSAITNTGVLAKGDLIVGDGVTDPVLLNVGANGTILSADSGEASGVKWADPLAYTEVADEGTLLTQRRAINFTGAGVSAADTNGRTTVTIAGGSPGGANTNVQFNDASSFGGEVSLSWNKTLNVLGVSRDAGQTGYAFVISSDTGTVLANFSKDGAVYADTAQIGKRVAIGAANGSSISMDVGGSFRTVPIQLTDATTITTDASLSNTFFVTLTGQPRTLAKPTNGTSGQKITFKISQDATGSRKIGFGAGIELSSGTTYDASTTAGRNDYIGMINNGISWDVVAIAQDFGG